jgi:hypothetical protein
MMQDPAGAKQQRAESCTTNMKAFWLSIVVLNAFSRTKKFPGADARLAFDLRNDPRNGSPVTTRHVFPPNQRRKGLLSLRNWQPILQRIPISPRNKTRTETPGGAQWSRNPPENLNQKAQTEILRLGNNPFHLYEHRSN